MTNLVTHLKRVLFLTLATGCLFFSAVNTAVAESVKIPVKLILDTDMAGDADDAGTLAMLHAMADLGECELLAVAVNRKDLANASAAAADAINTYYGRPDIPIGTDKVGPTARRSTSLYTAGLRDGFPNDIGPDDLAPDALDVYRQALRKQANGAVTICSVGALSNLAELWRQEPELVRAKVQRLVVMGGEVPPKERAETNIATHPEAARLVANEWPTEILWQGFKVGQPVFTGEGLKQTPATNPVRRAFELRRFGNRFSIDGGQPSYDQAAAFFAVRGEAPILWEKEKGGRLSFDQQGFSHWVPDEKSRHVLVRRVCPPQMLAKRIESLMVAPPKNRPQEKVTLRIRDAQGREIVPGGFVTITEDSKGKVRYTAEDYWRMVRMGANFQVIRTTLGRLGGWPGKEPDPTYLDQLDEMVRLGREAGLQNIFKMVIYDLRPFRADKWDAIYHNTNGCQDALIAAWEKVWIRYKDDPSVFGYDLLNEPQCGLESDWRRCCRNDLLPTLRQLAEAMHAISPEKWALYQPLYKETGTGEGPFAPMVEPFGRDRVIYAPHLYSMDMDRMIKMRDKYMREAALSHAPLLLGEWGPATDISADKNPEQQAQYTNVYRKTANALDQQEIGAIKAWYCGTRAPLRSKSRPNPFTWAIFSDTSATGKMERKFITDVLCRPRPLAVAGHIEHYGFDFETRTLNVVLKPEANLGCSEFFVPVDRYYPNGVTIRLNDHLSLDLKPGAKQLVVRKADHDEYRKQSSLIRWDANSQHLLVEKWGITAQSVTLNISPLTKSGS